MISEADQSPSDRAIREAYRARVRSAAAGSHPDEDAWEAFASGTMEHEARLRLADHVVSCESCRPIFDAVSEFMQGAAAFDADAPPAPGTGTGTAWWWRHAPTLAVAATVVLVVGAAALYVSNRSHESTTVETSPASPVVAPMVTSPEPVAPAYRLAMIKPDVQLPADLLVATRGTAGAQARQFLERFGEAIAPYREGRFEDAAARFEALTATHGDVAEVWFYLGVSQLFADRPEQALIAFDRPGVAAAVGDDLPWQRAVALERLGRGQESDAVLRSLCGRDGRYREQACAALTADARTPVDR